MSEPSTPPGEHASDGDAFLAGGGEMGYHMRRLDWSGSPLGWPRDWPQSLRTAVSILLNSRYPMFIAWGPRLGFLYNDGYLPILGAKHPGALGQRFEDVWADIWADIRPLVDLALAGDATWSNDLQLFMDRTGYLEETYFTFSYSPVRDESGAVGGMFCACTETTGRILGERRLQCLRDLAAAGAEVKSIEQAEQRCLAALDAHGADIPFALLYRRQGDEFRLCGTSNVDLAGRRALSELTGCETIWPVAAVVRDGRPEIVDVPGHVAGMLPSEWGDPTTKAYVAPLIDGGRDGTDSALVLGVSCRRALDDDYRSFLTLVTGSIASAAANGRNFEDQRRRAEALAEIDRAKTAFFANVSHEFRTPLTLIMAPLEDALGSGALPPEDRRGLALAHRNSLRLQKMVNALLDFSRIEAGRTTSRFVATDLGAFTGELASNFQSACDRAGLTLAIDCPPLSEPAYVDPEHWEKIVLNLLSNAFKYTLAGGIAVSLRERPDAVVLQVEDTGVGIAQADLTKIFDRFSRIEGSRGRSHEGTGIGLALVRELVKLHGGEIEVRSELNRGTSFSIAIPRGRAHLPAEQIGKPQAVAPTQAPAFVDEAMQWAAAIAPTAEDGPSLPAGAGDLPATPGLTAPGAAPARVLWVDDNADMRDYVGRLLGTRFRVDAVGDGETALAAAMKTPYDLVLSDVMLPGLDGRELLKRLRADDRTRDIPFVLLSARAGEEAKVEALMAGADDYMVKPFAARELLARVEAQVNARRIRQEASAALRESEARFRTLADNAPVMVWVTESTGLCSFLSLNWYEFTGQTPETGLGDRWLDAIHPDDRPTLERLAMPDGADGRAFRGECRLRRFDGAYRWALVSASPRFSEDGGFLGCIGSLIDIHERKRSEEHRALLVDELNHRVKNTLAVVQGLARQTFGGQDVPRVLRHTFEGRLAALAAAHSQLTESNWRDAPLDRLARNVVRALGIDLDRVSVEGPTVALPPRIAVAMTMALNELCTNARKYGSLSTSSGQVSLTWSIVDGRTPRLALRWRESGGPRVEPPSARGFGSRLIERALAQDFEGEAKLDFRTDGLVFVLDAPLPAAEDDRLVHADG